MLADDVFVLRQNVEAFDYVQQQLAACDTAIEGHLQTLTAHTTQPTTSLPPPRPRQKPRDNEPRFELRTPLHHLTGVDLSQLDGIGPRKSFSRMVVSPGAESQSQTTSGALQDPARRTRAGHTADRSVENR